MSADTTPLTLRNHTPSVPSIILDDLPLLAPDPGIITPKRDFDLPNPTNTQITPSITTTPIPPTLPPSLLPALPPSLLPALPPSLLPALPPSLLPALPPLDDTNAFQLGVQSLIPALPPLGLNLIKPRMVSQKLEGVEREKIRQAVTVGSIFLALEHDFCSPKAVLKWLATAEVSERTQIAYKAVTMRLCPNHQYLDDGWHFLVKQPSYGYLALQLGLNPEISDHKHVSVIDQTDINPIMSRIVESYAEVINSQRSVNNLSLLLNGSGKADYIQINLTACYRARNFPHLRGLTAQNINAALIEADWPEKFRYGDKAASLDLARLILQRVSILQTEAPIYLEGVAYKVYHPTLLKLHQDKLLTTLDREELIILDTFFPNIIDRKILAYDDLTFKLALLGNDIGGYVLGFPIQNIIPNDGQIHTALAMLLELGKQSYAERIQAFTKRTYIPELPIVTETPTFSNTTDVLMDEIDPYVTFDIVAYQDGSYIYRFSRPEFNGLLESKKNPWTNNWLPPTILALIRARVEAAKELNLPPARPMLEMLDRIESKTLFEVDPIRPVLTPAPTLVQPTLPEPLNPLQAAINGAWVPGLPNSGLLVQHAAPNIHGNPNPETRLLIPPGAILDYSDSEDDHHNPDDDDDDEDTPHSGDY